MVQPCLVNGVNGGYSLVDHGLLWWSTVSYLTVANDGPFQGSMIFDGGFVINGVPSNG